MKNVYRIFGVILTLMIFTVPISAFAQEKSDMQIAQELIYGKWAIKNSSWIKYDFDEDNMQILKIIDVNPLGESHIRVRMKGSNGQWLNYNSSLCWIWLENNQYKMMIIHRDAKGNEAQSSDDRNKEYVKVYWNY